MTETTMPDRSSTSIRDESNSGSSLPGQVDIKLYFPPQWSPFQPFLSTPSLRAYLEPLGFRIEQDDLNVGFYEYFISSERLAQARRRLSTYVKNLGEDAAEYRARCVLAMANLAEYDTLAERVGNLRTVDTLSDVDLFYERIKAFESLLSAFSAAEPVIDIGHSHFTSGRILSSFAAIDTFIHDYNSNPFLTYFDRIVTKLAAPPRYFGISIIGSEQILAGLTLGHVLKRHFPDSPIIIGGSVFSRLVEKTEVIERMLGSYFDYVCRYEGERPLAAFLASAAPRAERVPNLAFVEHGKLVLTDLMEPIDVDAVPTPDFTGLPLPSYFAPALVLPLLSTRGCYWGKCAFCYHGMIYQDRYRMRNPELIASDLATLRARFGARHFAFNDEALPPKLFRLLPETVPWGEYYFTGLYKFEKFFKPEYFKNMYGIGFRSLYIGLESASERVQKHMLKNNKQKTMLENLQYGHDAGIWNHTFNFFGFPTETEDEAQETMDFLLAHADIIHSEGTGTFSFEKNAPISHAPDRFGVTNFSASGGDLSLYYDYEVASGLDAAGAQAALAKFRQLRTAAGVYQSGSWIPREFLLLLLSHHNREALRSAVRTAESRQKQSRARDPLYTVSIGTAEGEKHFVANRKAATVSETNRDAVKLLSMLREGATVGALISVIPEFSKVFPLGDETEGETPIVVVNLDGTGEVFVSPLPKSRRVRAGARRAVT